MNANLPPKMPHFSDWLDEATAELAAAGISSARLDSELLLAHTIGKPRTYLHAHLDQHMTDRHLEIANARLALRLDRVPIAYIIGHKEFYGRRFRVTTATLIPRPESEDMITLLKKYAEKNLSLIGDRPRLVDVGTGSGALGITAKLELPELDVTLTDISRHALNVATTNADQLGAEVTILQGDLLEPFPFQADYILANLPYVDESWERSPETNHEPAEALFASQNGQSVIFRLIDQIRPSIRVNGYVFIEADPVQHPAIIKKAKQANLQLAQQYGYQQVFIAR